MSDEYLDKIRQMEYIPGFPRTPDGILGFYRAVRRIVQDQPHKKLTALETAKMALDRAMDTCERFPTIPELHQIYRKMGFRPADEGPVPEDICAD